MNPAKLLLCAALVPLVYAQQDDLPEGDPGADSETVTQTKKDLKPPDRFIATSGRVLMWDGSPPPKLVKIEEVCSNGSVRAGGYTDSQGRFHYELGSRGTPSANASMSWSNTQDRNESESSGDCSPQPSLPGYRSVTQVNEADASQRQATIVLYLLEDITGSTESATGLLAPPAARSAFTKGKEAARKNKPDNAAKEFRRAVELHPKYAAAWYELGRIAEGRQKWEEAREAHRAAIAADPKYIPPRVSLYEIAHRLEDWPALEKHTSELVRLNPFEYPAAYYYNAIALLRQRRFEEAETAAREAIHADHKKQNPKTHYILGAVLASRKDYGGAAASLRTFLSLTPKNAPKNDPAIAKANELLALVEAAR